MSHKALVLLVEDEKGIRNFISTVLDVNNYRVVEARDGKEALELSVPRFNPAGSWSPRYGRHRGFKNDPGLVGHTDYCRLSKGP